MAEIQVKPETCTMAGRKSYRRSNTGKALEIQEILEKLIVNINNIHFTYDKR